VKGVPHEQLFVFGDGKEQSIVCLIQRLREVGQCSFNDLTIALNALYRINLADCPSKPVGVSVEAFTEVLVSNQKSQATLPVKHNDIC
jgi:hypothetical protein